MEALTTSDWQALRTTGHVWHVCPDSLPVSDLERRVISGLTHQELARHERLRTDHLRHVFLATRWLCRSTLSRYTGVDPKDWTFAETRHGKPTIAGPVEFMELQFNLTHTQGLVACLVSRAGEVGVDAEELSRKVDFEGIAANFFSHAERAALETLSPQDRPARFLVYWVVKEAYLKGRGTGLSQAPEGFTIEWGDKGQPLSLGDWQLSLHHPTRQHIAATAVRPHVPASSIPIVWHAIESIEQACS